ncbi:MAG TPA: hypothetical protein VG496_09015 [Myxococcales bacterium]|nr:hypothetical protein [Myxococcales bacterium]
MRLVRHSAVLVLALAGAAVAQGQQPPGPRPANQPPPPTQIPPEIVPDSSKAETTSASSDWMAEWDALWKRRNDPAVVEQLEKIVEDHLAQDPDGFETNWRKAALIAWEADGEPDGSQTKAAKGKIAWEAADKAIRANQADVRGHYYAGVGVGLYSEGVGILAALSQGLEGKFRERLLAALKINKDFLDGAPQVVWGRYFYKLPWPKRDPEESIKVLTAAVKTHPNNWRAKLYLADSLHLNGLPGQDDQAHQLVDRILAAPGGNDPAEEARIKERARKWKADH